MDRLCHTRFVKNARFLQSAEVGFIPKAEPLDGFQALVPASVLRRLERLTVEEIKDGRLAEAVSKRKPPAAQTKAAGPLFSGTLRFMQVAFSSSSRSRAGVPISDLETAMRYASLAVGPISAYASQYGPNRLAVAVAAVPFNAAVTDGKYNDSVLSGWVDKIAGANGLGSDSCLVFLNPQGVVNTDADPTQGVMGYHNLSSSGIPYVFVNVMGAGLTIDDRQDVYAMALSHEIAEMTVDPRADGSNPEVSDPCSGNCSVGYRNYFDQGGSWLGGVPPRSYSFFTDGIATPATVAQCPAPASSCTYPPPRH